MKKILPFTSIILTLILLFLISIIPGKAASSTTSPIEIISEQINIDEQFAQQTCMMNSSNSIYYIFANPSISYCSQITSNEKIIFSYVSQSTGLVLESNIYNIGDIYTLLSIDPSSENSSYDIINTAIINNLNEFEYTAVNNTTSTITPANAYNAQYTTLTQATTSAFQADFNNRPCGFSEKTYNGTIYNVYCVETQMTSTSTPDSQWFIKDTALSSVIAFAIGLNWLWVGAIAAVVSTVVTTVVVNSVDKTAASFTAERCIGSCTNTRFITAGTSDTTQYWAARTRKMYFFKGDQGWTKDYAYHYDNQHSDFNDIPTLLEKGFQNYITNNL